MNERRSAVLLNKLSSKEKDPLSFIIPYQVSNLQINNALADLGADISLMPYTMYEKLGLREPKPTGMSLELVDRSIQYPRGIVENLLIKVDKFVHPIDFVILDILEDSRIPIILRRPLLATARAMIDVFNKTITLRVGDDEAKVNDVEPWYEDYVNYIVEKVVPPKWTSKKRKRFYSQVKNYFWDEPYAFRLCPYNMMRRCVAGNEIIEILAHSHSGPTRGHHSASIT
uniref:Reverse transcriptase domain-containing protein n=1 Tax=Tanacetum cinerariifolium TaxID=118510 RepID=A0A6L2LIK8_TANCI|nr:hypothetical protein [Tanacetum cinerariifolium]